MQRGSSNDVVILIKSCSRDARVTCETLPAGAVEEGPGKRGEKDCITSRLFRHIKRLCLPNSRGKSKLFSNLIIGSSSKPTPRLKHSSAVRSPSPIFLKIPPSNKEPGSPEVTCIGQVRARKQERPNDRIIDEFRNGKWPASPAKQSRSSKGAVSLQPSPIHPRFAYSPCQFSESVPSSPFFKNIYTFAEKEKGRLKASQILDELKDLNKGQCSSFKDGSFQQFAIDEKIQDGLKNHGRLEVHVNKDSSKKFQDGLENDDRLEKHEEKQFLKSSLKDIPKRLHRGDVLEPCLWRRRSILQPIALDIKKPLPAISTEQVVVDS